MRLLSIVLVATLNRATAQTEREQPSRAGAVVFVSEAESGMPLFGAIVRDSVSGSQATTGGDGTRCRIAYFVNGSRWNEIPSQANAYEAIEFYPSATMAPADIIGALAFDVRYCGIYVLWLRESS